MTSVSTTAQAEEVTAIFAGGCFWCMESEFESMEGVTSVISGYTGGDEASARYDKVSTKQTTHVEAVEVRYDPNKINYERLLEVYWGNIDPTDAGGQMYDRGPQYATVIYYSNDTEKTLAEASKQSAGEKLGKPIATRIEPAQPFYRAEDEHQDYYKKNPHGYAGYVQGSRRKEKLKEVWNE